MQWASCVRGFFFPDRETVIWTPMSVMEPAPDAIAGKRGRMTVINALGAARARR